MAKWSDAIRREAWDMKGGGMSYHDIAQNLTARTDDTYTAEAVRWQIRKRKRKQAPPKADIAILQQRNKELQRERDDLEKALSLLQKREQYHIHKYFGDYIRFGIVSDTQMGSQYENLNWLHHCYDIFEREKIATVYHPGDLVEGIRIYKGQEFEIHVHGHKAQKEYCIENYPRRDGIVTYVIGGNHDYSFWKLSGADIVEEIADKRDDINYMGFIEADIEVTCDSGKAIIRLVHPTKGTAYAVSYQPQQYINSLSGGEKPNVCIFGHYHKSEFLPYRNVQCIQGGCCQYQTMFMKGKHIAAVQGAWIIEMLLDGDSVRRLKQEWIPCYK